MTPTFSRRSAWPSEENALSSAVAKRRAQGLEVLDLTASNPTTAELPYDAASVLEPLTDSRALIYQPDPLGIASARETVAERYRQRGVSVDASRVMITASSSESYAFLFALLADPGDEILIPAPSYPLLSFLADLSVLKLVPYSLSRHDDWRPDSSIESLISSRTKAIVSVSPNNPTGSYLDQDDLARLVGIAERHGLAVIQDEVFSGYVFGTEEHSPSIAAFDGCLTFALDGLSKAAALPHMKLGWIIANGPPALVERAMERLALIADTFLSVATPVQHALPKLLDGSRGVVTAIRERAARNLAKLSERFRVPNLARLWPVRAGVYATLQVPATRSDDAWTLDALEHGVLIQPGHFYDYPPSVCTVVISLLTPESVFDIGIERLDVLFNS
ncbi:MAG: pyridoxal phosphate-dependent aminotransferase [Polyangiaceae bacterium]